MRAPSRAAIRLIVAIVAIGLASTGALAYRAATRHQPVITRPIPIPVPTIIYATITATPEPMPAATTRETIIIHEPGKQTTIIIETPEPQPTATVTCKQNPVTRKCRK